VPPHTSTDALLPHLTAVESPSPAAAGRATVPAKHTVTTVARTLYRVSVGVFFFLFVIGLNNFRKFVKLPKFMLI
jgi:hypothetical protein